MQLNKFETTVADVADKHNNKVLDEDDDGKNKIPLSTKCI